MSDKQNTNATIMTPGMHPGLYQQFQSNVVDVWNKAGYTGKGVSVAILDQGLDPSHPEFKNRDTSGDVDRINNDGKAEPETYNDNHGTAVAGVIAASMGNIKTSGLAPDVKLSMIYNPLFTSTLHHVNRDSGYFPEYDIVNNSWYNAQPLVGFDEDGAFLNQKFEANVIYAVNEGRDGLGTVIVFSAGNNRDSNSYVTSNNPHVIAVGAVDTYDQPATFTSPGANVAVSMGGAKILTTDRVGSAGYSDTNHALLNGTSFAAPAVSSVVALMLEANPEMGYRDVKEILMLSAEQPVIDISNPRADYFGRMTERFEENGAGPIIDGHGFFHHYEIGAGIVDAYNAVRLAETHQGEKTYANMETISISRAPDLTIKQGETASYYINVDRNISVEHVSVTVDMDVLRANSSYNYAPAIVLTGPNGDSAESVLLESGYNAENANGNGYLDFTFSSLRNWGEESKGKWGIHIRDDYNLYQGSTRHILNAVNLEITGATISNDDTYYFTDDYLRASAEAIRDWDGKNTLNLAMATEDIFINEGQKKYVIGSEKVNFNGSVKAIFGGDGDDRITGNKFNDDLWGGRGNDMLNGGQGYGDTALYRGSSEDVNILFRSSTDVRVDTRWTDQSWGKDILKNMEFLKFGGVKYKIADLFNEVMSSGVGLRKWTDLSSLTENGQDTIADSYNGDANTDHFEFAAAGNAIGGGDDNASIAHDHDNAARLTDEISVNDEGLNPNDGIEIINPYDDGFNFV